MDGLAGVEGLLCIEPLAGTDQVSIADAEGCGQGNIDVPEA